jgi:hypothetical protein
MLSDFLMESFIDCPQGWLLIPGVGILENFLTMPINAFQIYVLISAQGTSAILSIILRLRHP